MNKGQSKVIEDDNNRPKNRKHSKGREKMYQKKRNTGSEFREEGKVKRDGG